MNCKRVCFHDEHSRGVSQRCEYQREINQNISVAVAKVDDYTILTCQLLGQVVKLLNYHNLNMLLLGEKNNSQFGALRIVWFKKSKINTLYNT